MYPWLIAFCLWGQTPSPLGTSVETTSLITLVPGYRGRQFWDDNTLYTQSDHQSPWEAEQAGVPGARKPLVRSDNPPASAWEWVKAGRLFATRRRPGSKGFELVSRPVGLPWESHGMWPGTDTPGRFWGWRLLDRDRILAKADMLPFFQRGKASWLAILRKNLADELEIDELVDEGLDYWPSAQLRVNEIANVWPGKELLREDLALSRLEHMENHSCLVLPRSGAVLVFDGSTGRLRRTARLYPSMSKPENAKLPKDAVLLGWRPTQDGNLMMAARSEDACLYARTVFGAEKTTTKLADPKAVHTRLSELYSASFTSFPEIRYWEFDPATGDFRPRSLDGMPRSIQSLGDYLNFNLWISCRGEIQPRRGSH